MTDMSEQLLHLFVSEALEGVQALGREQVVYAEAAAAAPRFVAGNPSDGAFRSVERRRDRAVEEVLAMCLEDEFGCLRRGGDDGGDGAEAESDERAAVDF